MIEHVWKLKSFQGVATTSTLPPLQESDHLALMPGPSGGLSLTNPATGGLSLTNPATGGDDQQLPAAGGRRELKGIQSELSDAAPPTPENAEVKKARAQMETLKMLKTNMLDAVAANKWVHREGTLSPSSVHHWVGVTVCAVEELATEKPDDATAQRICSKFTEFPVQLLTKHPVYPALVKFAGIIPRLLAICGPGIDAQHRDDGLLIRQLACIGEESDAVLDLSGISYFTAAQS